MEEKNVNTILETLAKEIRSLKCDLYLREAENERLREENKSLKAGIEELVQKKLEATNG